MARWEPDARGRLSEAAMELFEERGYDGTTVEDIAARAGVTKRTFFRHFADKREALFAPGDAFIQLFVDGLAGAPPDAAPLEAIAVALRAAAAGFPSPHARARRRQRVLAASAELRERELVKLAAVAEALAAGLRERGAGDPAAGMAAEAGLAVFRNAFERWVAEPDDHGLQACIDESLAALRAALVSDTDT